MNTDSVVRIHGLWLTPPSREHRVKRFGSATAACARHCWTRRVLGGTFIALAGKLALEGR